MHLEGQLSTMTMGILIRECLVVLLVFKLYAYFVRCQAKKKYEQDTNQLLIRPWRQSVMTAHVSQMVSIRQSGYSSISIRRFRIRHAFGGVTDIRCVVAFYLLKNETGVVVFCKPHDKDEATRGRQRWDVKASYV